MTIVMFEMVALGFEDIIVLVFHLPPCSSCLNKGRDIRPSERKIGNKGILIEDFSIHIIGRTPIQLSVRVTGSSTQLTARVSLPPLIGN